MDLLSCLFSNVKLQQTYFLLQHLGLEQCLDLVFYFVSLVFVSQKTQKYGIMKQSDLHRIPSFLKEHCV